MWQSLSQRSPYAWCVIDDSMTHARNEPGLRQRTRDAVRGQIAATAIVMFDNEGFDEVTVDQIAAAVGISPRSFFRYFPTKEDVVIGDPLAYFQPIRDRLATSLETLPVWDAVRAAFSAGVVAWVKSDPAGTLRVSRVLISTPSLRARNTEKHLAWQAALEPLIADALPESVSDRSFRARTITLASLTCLDASLAEWVDREGLVDYGTVLDQAFDLLKPAALEIPE
jgi:AcrR family transcriptional regulator